MKRYSAVLGVVALAAMAGLSACSDSPTVPEQQQPRKVFRLSARTGEPVDVPAVRMDLPPAPRPWDTSDSALIAAIAAEDGHAVVAFREVSSARALATGIRAAVTAGSVRAGIAMLQGRGVEIVRLFDAIGAVHVRMDPALAPEIRGHALVDYVEPRQWMRLAGSPFRAPGFFWLPLGTPETTPWGITMVRAPEAWTVTTGSGVRIELIDTGHDRGHEDLPLVPTGNCAGAYGGCDDGEPLPHGSHVLGIWTARDNTVGVVGVAPGIVGADVYVYGACNNDGDCPTDEVTAGINAGIWNADVINLSLGRDQFDLQQSNAVAQAWANDIVIVAAAGNNRSGVLFYPAAYTNVVGVSGVRTDGSFASSSPCPLQGGGTAYSNYGSHVDLAGPFWALSTVPGGYESELEGWCGTSMATPHVSGTAALLRAQHPDWTNQQVVTRLFNTAEDRGTAGRDDYYGYGIVDAAEAVGVLPPFEVYADAPGFVTVKKTYPLTGSASHPASNWQWDQSYEGGPWSFWANTQNSAFVAYGGTYTLDWRLFARRVSDGATDYGYATTRVCIPFNPSCYVAAAQAAPPVVTGSDSTTHFGSGVWVGLRGPLGNAAVRFYSFLGRHDLVRGAAGWPNLLDSGPVDWTGYTSVGIQAVRVTSGREAPAPGVDVYRVSGRIDGLTSLREVAVALAADPDIGAPQDDRLDYDTDFGLVTVYDGGPTYLGYLALTTGSGGDIRVHQFDVGPAEEPRRSADAYTAMLESSALQRGQPTDVRFVLTVPRVPVAANGTFHVSFAVVWAGSAAELRARATTARQVLAAAGSATR